MNALVGSLLPQGSGKPNFFSGLPGMTRATRTQQFLQLVPPRTTSEVLSALKAEEKPQDASQKAPWKISQFTEEGQAVASICLGFEAPDSEMLGF